jgi:hypothetical protein
VQFDGPPAQTADFGQRVAPQRTRWNLARNPQDFQDARFERRCAFRFNLAFRRDDVGREAWSVRPEGEFRGTGAQALSDALERKGLQQSQHV